MIPSPALTLFLSVQSGGGSVPPMKVVTPGASRLKAAQGQAGSPDKGKHGKQRAEYMRIQAQQQVSLGASGAGPQPHAAPRSPHPPPHLQPPAVLCTPAGRWLSPASIPVPTILRLSREVLPVRTAPLVPQTFFSFLSQYLSENIARSLITPLAEGPSLRAREDHLPSCSWTRQSERTPMPGPF